MAASATKYEEFLPTTETVQEKDGDTIRLYVPGFKKGQLRVQLTSTNQVRISGEKESEGGKYLRFRKEFPVKPNTDANRISAKYENDILQVKLPKLSDQESEKTADSAGKESDQVSDQKRFNDNTRNANDDKENAATMESSEIGQKLSKGNAATIASSEIGRKLSKMALCAVVVGLVVVGVGIYFTNVEKSHT